MTKTRTHAVIIGNRVVYRCCSHHSASRFVQDRKLRNASVCYTLYSTRTRHSARTMEEAEILEKAKRCRIGLNRRSRIEVACYTRREANPRAMPLSVESGWLVTQIADAADDNLISIDYSTGEKRSDSDLSYAPASNAECAHVTLRIDPCAVPISKATFDTRKRLPSQIAKWLRVAAHELSARLLQAADVAASIDDDRDLRLICKFVAGDPTVKYSTSHGLVDTTRPLPIERWPASTDNFWKRLAKTAEDLPEGV